MSIRLSTVALEQAGFNLIDRLPENPLAYIRGGEGLVGWGEALRIEARGENRIQDLAIKWRELAANAVVDDQVIDLAAVTGLSTLADFVGSDTFEQRNTLLAKGKAVAAFDH